MDHRVLLVRHGETAWNAQGRFVSSTDLPLSEEGVAMLRRLAPTSPLAVHRVFSSPAKRALQTARILFPQHDIEIAVELRELDFGEWEGLTPAEVMQSFPESLYHRQADPIRFRPPEGENFEDVSLRLRRWLSRVGSLPPSAAIVAHRGTLAVLERILRNLNLADRSVNGLAPGELRWISVNYKGLSFKK